MTVGNAGCDVGASPEGPMVDLATAEGVLQFCADAQKVMADEFRACGEFRVPTAFLFARNRYELHNSLITGPELPCVQLVPCDLDHVADRYPLLTFAEQVDVFAQDLHTLARVVRAIGYVFCFQAWILTRERGQKPSRAQVKAAPDARRVLRIFAEHKRLPRIRSWEAAIGEGNSLEPWVQCDPAGGVEGRFASILRWAN